ncbi:class II aldolase and Adducin domain-containing protein [Xylariaceae sp. FL1651]|nr:class II aldolase and Adducin domain-containing protein [Xylariaceae sp. FL1651]
MSSQSTNGTLDVSSVAISKGTLFPRPPTFDDPLDERRYLKERLTLAFRLFAKQGYEEGVAGHIAVCDPVEPKTFWVNPFGVAWTMLRASDLIRVDYNGEIIDSGPVCLLNKAGLGSKKAAILSNHGILTCGGSVESCVFWYMSLERSCQAQLLADAAAAARGSETVKVSADDALFTYKTVGFELAGWFSAKPAFDTMERQSGNEHKM